MSQIVESNRGILTFWGQIMDKFFWIQPIRTFNMVCPRRWTPLLTVVLPIPIGQFGLILRKKSCVGRYIVWLELQKQQNQIWNPGYLNFIIEGVQGDKIDLNSTKNTSSPKQYFLLPKKFMFKEGMGWLKNSSCVVQWGQN